MIDSKSCLFSNSVKTKEKGKSTNSKEIQNHKKVEDTDEEKKIEMIEHIEDLMEEKHIEIPGGNDYFLGKLLGIFSSKHHTYLQKLLFDYQLFPPK